MILADGEIYAGEEQSDILDGLEQQINATREQEQLSPDVVIDAIDRLGRQVAEGEFDALLAHSGLRGMTDELHAMARLLSREYLECKLETELGRDFLEPREQPACFGLSGVQTRAMPLGTLFHIAAGNMDFLPAMTVAEGLLTGNVNLLKLPQADNGITVTVLRRLMDIEPRLKHFVYVFDTPSSDLATIKRLADMADGIVVWGGEAAVAAVRNLAPAGVKLIEWGHRLSFAYLSGHWRERTEELSALAVHIVKTGQLLCSSCQTVFLDTEDMGEVEAFCRAFLPYLEMARREYPIQDIGVAAQLTLERYSGELEALLEGNSSADTKTFGAGQCRLTACEDSELVLSDLFGRVPVKRLPRGQLMTVLRRQKGRLQTAGLCCDAEEFDGLADRLLRCGVNRVTSLGDMSAVFVGESHDGEYSLRRYVRMTNIGSDLL